MRRPSLKPRRLIGPTALALAVGGMGSVWALSLGPVRTVAVMGQPLDASIELVLQPGEVPSDGCVQAQVNAGDVPLPASQVSAQVIPGSDGSARVRVRTSTAIDEPFLTLTVSVGCEVRFARQFTVFADPPVVGASLQAQPFRGASLAETAPAPVRADAPAAATAGDAPPRPSSVTAGRSSSGEIKRAARSDVPAAVPPPANRARAAALAAAAPAISAPEDEGRSVSEQRVSTGTVTRGEGVARLKLDTPTVSSSTKGDALMRASQQRDEAMATAKIAVDAAAAANASVAQKIIEIEAQLVEARKELAALHQAIAKVQAERAAPAASAAVAAAPAVTPAVVAPVVHEDEPWYAQQNVQLGAAGAALLLLGGALFMRLRRTDAQRLQGWHGDPAQATSYSEFDTVGPSSEQFAMSQYTASPATIPAHAPPVAPAPPKAPSVAGNLPPRIVVADAPTMPAPLMPDAGPTTLQPMPSSFTDSPPSTSFDLNPISRFGDITIEELLDVEQQAEFFVVLGQDDAAIELLTNHVKASGGASPMPYLKLLEIFRRTGDQTSYERTRKRFNARFNGVAPEWGADPNAGRGLVDYPDVLARVERCWPNPVDAMAELQTLMFRNDSNLLFDLPAYRDIMMLFTLARDHHEGRATDGTPVDVLLPLNMGGEAAAETPLPPLPPLRADLMSTTPSATAGEPAPLDDKLRLALEDPSATVQVSVRRR